MIHFRKHIAALTIATAISSLLSTAAVAADKVSMMISWRPQADYGGYYYAQAKGIYEKYGLEVEIRPGGPQIDGAALLLAGRVDFLSASAFAGLHYAREKLPFTVVAAVFQKDPQILMVHPESGYSKLEDIKGAPTFIGASSRTSFWPFLKARYGYPDEQIRPFTGSYATFLADKKSVQQGYIISDLAAVRRAGVDARAFLLADVGFENYANTINTSRKLIDSNPDLVRRFVAASMEGWKAYLAGDSGPAFAAIKAANPQMSDEDLNYNFNTMREQKLVESGDALTLGIGAMTDERWARFARSNIETGNLPANVDWKQAYTLQFVGKK